MWQVDWGVAPSNLARSSALPVASAIDPKTIEVASPLFWEEHCVECAYPTCYATCPLYVARPDQKCARFRYGIYPNADYQGLFGYGADISFRRWGKLESGIGSSAAPVNALRKLARQDTHILRIVNPVAERLAGVDHKRYLNRGYHLARDKRLTHFAERAADSGNENASPVFDEFVAEVHNPGAEPFALIIELIHEGRPGYRTSLEVRPGANLFRIPVTEMGIDFADGDGRLLVYPDGDAEVRAIFTWLDFVRYEANAKLAKQANGDADKPAAKVKVVAWDLDNTLWQGVLVEDGPEGLVLRPEVVDLIHKLDERGIVQAVVSKNDHERAWELIDAFGLAEMFVAVGINWGAKSNNLRQVAATLNLNLDSFAFIDDSPFERAEVSSELPQVRTVDALKLEGLLDLPEFDVKATAEGKRRRLSYLAEGKRREASQSFSDNYADFIRSCEIRAELFTPREPHDVARCLELIQRSNQLNLSTVRYTTQEFTALLEKPETLALALRVADRFGDYGIVGFASIDLGGERPILNDLVISCRIAQKKIEAAWFGWVSDQLIARGYHELDARFIPSARNGVLLETLTEIGFAPPADGSAPLSMSLLTGGVPDSDLVTVIDLGVQVPALVAAQSPNGMVLDTIGSSLVN
jgi:FkbH-like protein